jgi:cytochrome b561
VAVSYKDHPHDFGLISLILHWLNAILILMICFSGRQIQNPTSTLTQAEVLAVHTNVALLAIPIIIIRIIWRTYQGYPMPKQTNKYRKSIKFYNYFLFFLIVASYLSALYITSFNLFEIIKIDEAILSNETKALSMHQFIGIAIYFALLIHILGASKQILMSKGSYSKRMISLRDEN